MRTLPTITLELGMADGNDLWKVYFPFGDQAIRVQLEIFGLRYEPWLRASVLPANDGLPEKLRASFAQTAFVVVKNGKLTAAIHTGTQNPSVTTDNTTCTKCP